MGLYFSQRVLKHVRDNPGSTDPKEANFTLWITDIRNFTTLCEKSRLKEMFDLLSHAFGIQTEAAISNLMMAASSIFGEINSWLTGEPQSRNLILLIEP